MVREVYLLYVTSRILKYEEDIQNCKTDTDKEIARSKLAIELLSKMEDIIDFIISCKEEISS